MDHKPLKRAKELQQLSREHHHGLLLCWKIRTGFSKHVSSDRIINYANWFYHMHLLPHFELEEQHVFSILKNENDFVKQAVFEHGQLRKLFNTLKEEHLELIAQLLESHIRFEERILFPEIQQIATIEQLETIEAIHKEIAFVENESDIFWK